MTQYTVVLAVDGVSTPVALADSAIAGTGKTAYNQLMRGENIYVLNGDTEEEYLFIPYEAIVSATITTTTSADTPVVDAVCNETNS